MKILELLVKEDRFAHLLYRNVPNVVPRQAVAQPQAVASYGGP